MRAEFAAYLEAFTTKPARRKAEAMLLLIEQSLEARQWLPGARRKLGAVSPYAAMTSFDREYRARLDALYAPVGAAIALLDACRPKPQLTQLGASPTISKTLVELGVSSVELCPIEWFQRSITVDGKTTFIWVGRLLWPEHTRHGAGRFGAKESACDACGHRIRNPFNWVPFVAHSEDGPASLWVGRDCAETLFGAKFTGELVYEGPSS